MTDHLDLAYTIEAAGIWGFLAALPDAALACLSAWQMGRPRAVRTLDCKSAARRDPFYISEIIGLRRRSAARSLADSHGCARILELSETRLDGQNTLHECMQLCY